MALPDILPLEYDFIDNGAGTLMMVTQSFPKPPKTPFFISTERNRLCFAAGATGSPLFLIFPPPCGACWRKSAKYWSLK